MKKFKIEIIETHFKVIEVDAETEADALDIVNERYSNAGIINADIILGADDFIGVDIEVNRE